MHAFVTFLFIKVNSSRFIDNLTCIILILLRFGAFDSLQIFIASVNIFTLNLNIALLICDSFGFDYGRLLQCLSYSTEWFKYSWCAFATISLAFLSRIIVQSIILL